VIQAGTLTGPLAKYRTKRIRITLQDGREIEGNWIGPTAASAEYHELRKLEVLDDKKGPFW
jgi:hypothetical protein